MKYFSNLPRKNNLVTSRRIDNDVYLINSYWGKYVFAPLKGYAAKYNNFTKSYALRTITSKNNMHDKPLSPSRSCSVTLDLSHNCTLECRYCSVNSNDISIKMNKDIAKIAIDHIISNAISINFPKVGMLLLGKGEPTTNWDTLEFALKYLKNEALKHKLKFTRCIATNGLLPMNKLDYLSKNTEIIVLSWDGIERIQNLNRPLRNGMGSFKSVLKTANFLCNNRKAFHIRPTITVDSLKYISEITKLFAQYQPQRLLYQPKYSVGRGEHEPEVNELEFCDAFFEALPIAEKHGIILEYPGNSCIRGQFCSAYNGIGFGVSADGYLSGCDCVYNPSDKWGEHFIYGKIENDQITIDENKQLELKKIKPERIDGCTDCFAFYFCKGQCMNNHINDIDRFDPLSKRDNIGCKINKLIFLFKIIYQTERRLPNGIFTNTGFKTAWI